MLKPPMLAVAPLLALVMNETRFMQSSTSDYRIEYAELLILRSCVVGMVVLGTPITVAQSTLWYWVHACTFLCQLLFLAHVGLCCAAATLLVHVPGQFTSESVALGPVQ